MGEKSYLSDQVYLPGLNSYDLFTDEEFEAYMKIVEAKNELNKIEETNEEEKRKWITQKRKNQEILSTLIKRHEGVPRNVRLQNIVYSENTNENFPEGITWKNLKFSRKISEFCSELTRAMGLKHMDYTFDHVIIKWRSIDVLRQLVIDGFFMPLLNKDGSITNKHYHFYTASAGQLRRDKIQCISDDMWEKIRDRIQCGLTWEEINRRGGINVNKLMAYSALPVTATDEWTDFDIDRCIVIPEFKGKVTDRMMYINPDYTHREEICTVEIDHTDGCGMALPSAISENCMVRGIYFKGLLLIFDFLKFCREKNVPAVINDVYGLEHDLIKENIQIIFTESQFKMWKYYDSWDAYKREFKKCGAKFGKSNYEEKRIEDSQINYQFIQTLTDITDNEIKQLTKSEHDKILNITRDKQTMLEALKASEDSDNPYKVALALYPEMLREGYTRSQIKDIRKRRLFDAKSGRFKIKNKRLYAAPDLYAACEYWFQHIENPEGLLKKDEVACSVYLNYEKADVLRSPHLYMEHSIQKISHDPEVYRWLNTNAIYTSCHSMITRTLQLDVDGDMLNVVVEPLFVAVAERNINKYDVIPLFYDANKADLEIVSRETLYGGLKRAHDYSSGGITSIGEISNMLTRLWNKNDPDRVVAAWLTMFNNLDIDAAKSGKLSHYKDYPMVAKRVSKAIGGKHGRLPHWFQFSKNGRKDPAPGKKKRQYMSPNNSTMNRICAMFNDIGNINLNNTEVPPFNWEMFLSKPCQCMRSDIPELFCKMDNINKSSIIEAQDFDYSIEHESKAGYDLLASMIKDEMVSRYGSLERTYPYVLQFLFAGDNADKALHKQMFWRVYGDIAVENLRENLSNYRECLECGMKYPAWERDHACPKEMTGFYRCIDCKTWCKRANSKQCRCEDCQEEYKKTMNAILKKTKYKELKRDKEQRTTSLVSRLEKTF